MNEKMLQSIAMAKGSHLIGVNFLSLGLAWFMDADLEHLEWIKWPTTMGLGTLLYWIYSFYNSKRVNDKVDFDSITKELKDIINAYKAELEDLKKELQEKDSMIDHLNNKINKG